MNYRLVAAAGILALYAVLAIVLLILCGSWDETHWSQALTIFTSFGAIATAAASVLLGVEVQQANVDAARQRADEVAGQLGALRETHRVALRTAAASSVAAAQTRSADERLEQVRNLLAGTA